MTSDDGQLECPKCHKEFAPGSIINCPDDGTELTINFTAPDPLIGKTFADKYDILTLLGEGGMCKVYKARHKFMKRIVAVKLLHDTTMRDPQAKARFQKEAEAASALSHQNVVTVHDFGFTPSGQAFFVMDCLEGQTLEEMIEAAQLKGEKIPLARAIDIFAQGCDGMDHAHRKGIIHRDIKPSNIVVIKQEDGTDLVKIVDFGIAKVLSPPEGEQPQQITLAGEIFGTPAYMSPEQCNGQAMDGRSDLYSFACLMYETLSGTPPHIGDTFINTIVKHIQDRPKSFEEIVPDSKVPAHIEAVVMKCLEKSPSDRYASATELKQALFDAAYASGVKGMRFGAVPEPRPSGVHANSMASSQGASLSERKVTHRWRMGLIATVASITLVLSSIAGWMFFYPGPNGDRGTPYDKFVWSQHLSAAENYAEQKKFTDEVKELEAARLLALKFGDGQGRLENTLNRLSEAYGAARDYAKQEAANKELVAIATQKVVTEYEGLMAILKQWETPVQSNSERQERTLQAAAFAERIARNADKLSIRSRENEEKLLNKAIKVYDGMETRDWEAQVKFRRILGECYRLQQRAVEQERILQEAVALCPAKPNSQDGWREKVRANLMLGQLNRNLAVNTRDYDDARKILESALNMVRVNLRDDKEILRDALNSIVILYRMVNTKESNEKADILEPEARALETKLDAHAEEAAD